MAAADNLLNGGVGMSEKEANQLAQHFKDPQFCKLFEEYARELADPNARAEQDAYLAQLEAEGQLEGIYGKGVQVIQADPGVAVKTKTADGATRVYVNICTCAKVDKMVVEQLQGKQGVNITLPNMLGIKGNREGKAADGVPFKALDFVVHPETLSQCTVNLTLMDFLITTAIEKLEEATLMKLLRKHKMLAVQYKGVAGQQRPSLLVLRTIGQGENVDGRLRPLSEPGTAAAAAKAGHKDTSLSRNAARHSSGNNSRSNFSFQTPKPSHSSANMSSKDADSVSAKVVRTPRYQVVERARVDLGAAWSDAGRGLQISNVPEALVVRVDLPGVSSVAGVELSLTAGSVALEVPGKYQLQLSLRHKVLDQQASAKFFTSKQQLVLTLPVALPKPEPTSQPLGQPSSMQLIQELPQQQPQQAAAVQEQDGQGQTDQPGGQLQHNSVLHPSLVSAKVPLSANSLPGFSLPDKSSCSSIQQPCPVEVDDADLPEAAERPQSPPGAPGKQPVDHSDNTSQAPHTKTSRTLNQLKWAELHQQAAGEIQKQQDAAPGAAEAGAPPQQIEAAQAPAAKAAAPLLRPRLSSRRVCGADFV